MTAFYINRRNIILISVCFIICVTATFAWSSNEQTKVHSDNEIITKLTNLIASEKERDQAVVKEVLGMLEKLRFSEEQSEIYNKWDEYLVSRTHFNNHEHLATIITLGHDYAVSVKNLEECISLKHKKEKQYSDHWLEDLEKKYGKTYIINNRKSIGFILLGILCYRQSDKCIETRKDTFYKESLYSSILHRYAKYFVDYIATLDKDEQGQIKEKTDYAKGILEIPAEPLKEMLVPAIISDSIQITALNSRKDFDPELRVFLMQHPSFKELFDFNKALKDLQEYK